MGTAMSIDVIMNTACQTGYCNTVNPEDRFPCLSTSRATFNATSDAIVINNSVYGESGAPTTTGIP